MLDFYIMFFSLHKIGGLTAEANASPENDVTEMDLECEIFNKKDERCLNGDCPYRELCKGSPKAYCFAMWKNGKNTII